MGRKDDLISKIVDIEWRMFQNVANIGGTAACQEDLATFTLMRSSQGVSWSEPVLRSYLSDLEEAEGQGRNLLSEKYARMMKSTSPSEYEQIEDLLPPLDPGVSPLIDKIMEIVLPWEKEVLKKYPYIRQKSRPIYSAEDSPMMTSFETYFRGELETFSLKTLELYHKNVSRQKSKNINGNELVLKQMLKQYGFNSLEEANQKIKERMA